MGAGVSFLHASCPHSHGTSVTPVDASQKGLQNFSSPSRIQTQEAFSHFFGSDIQSPLDRDCWFNGTVIEVDH